MSLLFYFSCNSLGDVRSPQKTGNGTSAAPASRAVTEASALLVPNAEKPLGQRIATALRSVETIFIILCVAVIVVLAVLFAVPGDVIWVVYLVVYGIQRLPVIVLLTIILINRNETEGPGALSKLIILSAALLALLNDLPVTVWAEVCLFPLSSHSIALSYSFPRPFAFLSFFLSFFSSCSLCLNSLITLLQTSLLTSISCSHSLSSSL